MPQPDPQEPATTGVVSCRSRYDPILIEPEKQNKPSWRIRSQIFIMERL
jgi:hypothetical protein